MKPKTIAIKIVTIIFCGSVSNVKANRVNIIIVNEGGTKMVEMILANLCEENNFNIMVYNYTLIKLNILNCNIEWHCH